MKISLWVLLLGVVLVQGQQYCYEGNACQTDADCVQYYTSFSSVGTCCNGKCTTGYSPVYLQRGSTCNMTSTCSTCIGNDNCMSMSNTTVCMGSGLTAGCDCTGNGQCVNSNVGPYQISVSCSPYNATNNKCMSLSPRGATCSQNSTCAGVGCYQGTCLGANRQYGQSCRVTDECQSYYACTNGMCSYYGYNMTCTGNAICGTNLFCNSTSRTCANLLGLGVNCTGNGQCASNFCPRDPMTFQYTNCSQRIPAGGNCTGMTNGCASGSYCMNTNSVTFNSYQCIAYYSLADYSYCTTSSVCQSEICAKYGANTTSNFCIPRYSIPAGGNCSSDSTCPEYAQCNRTTFPATCTATFLNLPCQANNTNMNATTQCGPLVCSCAGTCQVSSTSGGKSCGSPPIGDPTQMNSDDMKSFASAYCCNLCSSAAGYSTSQTGFQIDCTSMTVTAKPVCNTMMGGDPLLVRCGAAATPIYFGVLFFLLASLLTSF